MIDVAGLSAVAAAFLVAAAAPGPATLALATVSMRSGRRDGLTFAMGLSIGLAFWGLVAATGFGAILQASGEALTILKLAGGAYLLWLAYSSGRSAYGTRVEARRCSTNGNHFARGLLLNLSNPKAVLAWTAALALGIGDQDGAGRVISATGMCIALGFAIYAVYAMAFSTAGAMGAYARLRRWIEGLAAGVFAIAGLSVIRSAFARQ